MYPFLQKLQMSQGRKGEFKQETKQDKVRRYLDKKKLRTWDRKISYACRKVVADSRVRINGRFIKKQDISPGAYSSAKMQETALEVSQPFSMNDIPLDEAT